MLTTFALRIIPKPVEGTRVVMVWTGGLPFDAFMKGGGETTCTCGNCGISLLKNVNYDNIHNIVYKCPICMSYNETHI